MKYLLISILLLLHFLLEYTWIPWEDVERYYTVPWIYDGGPIRLDALIYNASVKIDHLIPVLIAHILLPFRHVTKWMLLFFGLAFFELFLTWNEPVAKIPLPFHLWIPISISLLKCASVCWFMWTTVVYTLKWMK